MELLLAAFAAGFVVWLIMRRKRPAAVPAAAAQAPRGRSSGPGFIGWLLIIGVALFGIFYLLGASAPPQHSEASKWSAPGSQSTADPYDQTGCSASKRAVEARLKSPGSAKWVSCRVTTEAGVQTVTLAVDSQNAYGGLVRSEWITKVRNNNVESVGQMR